MAEAAEPNQGPQPSEEEELQRENPDHKSSSNQPAAFSDSAGKKQSSCDLGECGDSFDGTMLTSGEVNYKGKGHQLLLTQRGLRLLDMSSDKNGEGDADSTPVLDIPWREVMGAAEQQQPPKKTKSKTTAKEQKGGEGGSGGVFAVHYMERRAVDNKVQCRTVTLTSGQHPADTFTTAINTRCREGKPQKLLVIVNPIGGSGNARQLLTKRVQPLFALAGVELVIKVTERFQHAIEIAKTFDVKSVDGVVVMGGDGLYNEVVHGLTLRRQTEAAVDYNQPGVPPLAPSVRVGIIPAGTGNGATDWFNGIIDLETATLNIIRGVIERSNMLALYEGSKLLTYAGLFVANGFASSMMKRSEELRWMKKMRYAYVLGGYLFGKKRLMEFDIEVLKSEQDQTKGEEEDKDKGAEATDSSGWTKLGSRQIMTMFLMFSRFEVRDNDRFTLNPFRPNFDLLLMKQCSIADTMRFFLAFATKKIAGLQRPYIEWVRNVRGARFRLVQPPSSTEGASSGGGGASSSQQQTAVTELARVLDVDGEVVTLDEPSFEVRLLPQFLQVFAYSGYLNMEKAAS